MDSEHRLDLDRNLPVTQDEVDALRRRRTDVPSWFSVDWRELHALVAYDAIDRRPLANDAWAPFSLE